VSYAVETAVLQWEEGFRRLEAARSDASLYRALGRAVVEVQDELRKRLGSTFSVAELASLYREAGDWTLDPFVQTSESPAADSSTVVDAAFYLYMREAADFAGGRMRVES
jgi:hypothetical protein